MAKNNITENPIMEFHLFAGIGGGIYGGQLLGHQCCGSVEIDDFCNKILEQRQKDGWMEKFDIFGDLTKLNGNDFKGKFDVLCGGFPCQAFSHAAHGKNIAEKNLWPEMFRFAQESDAPVIFGENVVLKAIEKAKLDLESIGYKVERCKVSCGELGADHRRDRYWLLAVKDDSVFAQIAKHDSALPKLEAHCWQMSPHDKTIQIEATDLRQQLKAIGNAQSPYAAATAFRVLVNRHLFHKYSSPQANEKEILEVFNRQDSWIKNKYGEGFGLIHTPTTMANYSAPSMMKHQGCRNFVEVFGKPHPVNAEYLMGFPQGASSRNPQTIDLYKIWKH